MYTEEERKAFKERMRGFAKQVKAMTEAQRQELAFSHPIITCEGHTLSRFNNVVLILQGYPNITLVGGFNQWQKAGHKVMKGQHAAGYMYVPMVRKAKEGEEQAEPDDIRFRLVPVFDVTQTQEIEVKQAVAV